MAEGAGAAELAEAVAGEIIELLGADSSAVFRFDGDEIVVVGGGAAPGQRIFTRGARFPVEQQMLAAEIVRTGQPARSARYADDPSDAARRIRSLGYDVVIGAPVRVGGAFWGVIYAGALGPQRLPEGSEHDLSVFAELCTMAVATAEHRAAVESHAAEQEALMGVARAVLEGGAEDAVLDTVARAAALLPGAAAAALLRRVEGRYETVAAWPDEALPEPDTQLADVAVEARRCIAVGDPDDTARSGSPSVIGRPVGWAAPIEIDGSAWGVVVVGGEKGVPLPPDAADRVARFAELSGVAIAHVEARRALMEQLVETQRLVALVELSDDFIAIADVDGRTSYLNAGGRRLVGLESLEEARTKTILDYLSDEGRQHFLDISGPTTRRTGAFRGETTLRNFGTGELIPVSVSAFTITHPATGRPIGTAVVQHDLRERKRAEAELEQLAAARQFLLVEVLRSEERMRRQIGDALHDDALQELHAARLELDRIEVGDDAAARARTAIAAATSRLREAVSDLHPAVSSLHGLESRLRSVLEQGGDRAGFGHRLTIDPNAPGVADELLIALVRELVQNVVKHAGATFVVVDVAMEDGVLNLGVSDDGQGIAPGRPVEALRAGHIGLASARERVHAMGGSFEIGGDPGRGTTVRVSVPAVSPVR